MYILKLTHKDDATNIETVMINDALIATLVGVVAAVKMLHRGYIPTYRVSTNTTAHRSFRVLISEHLWARLLIHREKTGKSAAATMRTATNAYLHEIGY